jgi:ketosteroid isomerase-like protein
MNLKRVFAVVLMSISAAAAAAPAESPTTLQLTKLLREFLDAAGRSDRATFERFFADDVIYTRSSGIVVTKPEILKNIQVRANDGTSTFSAEDIKVHEYGDTAVVAFRLEGHTVHPDKSVENSHYRNTGTFLKRDGRWQAIAWQATKISEPAP